jgi:NADP-dependent 3-hydroxy acid dehydrogenase YdfG
MKHILITGGSSGLGKATAKKLIDEGFKVTILSRDEQRTSAVAKQLGCDYVVADVTDPAQVKRAMGQAGDIDVLINNAGVWIQGPLETNDPEHIKQTIDVNVTGVILCAQAVIPAMKRRKSGRIISISSDRGMYAKAERGPYCASKFAVVGFSKALQDELKPHKIGVTCFYPGAINHTDIFADAGIDREITTGINALQVADAIAYICKLPTDINVPEMGIENLNY